ncbi:cytochrome P450, partial [Choiromyces venosus 120613-1]
LPPGPPALPIIGNIHQLPPTDLWKQYAAWTAQYGPIFKLQLGSALVIVLGTAEVARELIVKRAARYSGRPRGIIPNAHFSRGLRPVLLNDTHPHWRLSRRLHAALLSNSESSKYQSFQELESLQVIVDFLHRPDAFAKHVHRFAASLMFTLCYGKRMVTGQESDVVELDKMVRNFVQAGEVGRGIVEAFPILEWLPKCVAGWKREGEAGFDVARTIYLANYREAKVREGENWVKKVQGASYVETLSELEVAFSVGVLYEAGTDTTSASLETFFLAATLFPAFITTAQSALDAICPDRIPTFTDLQNLPYITAIVHEVLRWRPVVISGLAHATTKPDEYAGYHIPAGTIVIPNHWGIHRDPAVYADPEEFRPERFLGEGEGGMGKHVAFGLGKRACPGRYLAVQNLGIVIARVLWGFDIRAGEKVWEGGFTQGIVSKPVGLGVCVEPR